MSKLENQRYYWLKLKEDFFDEDAIEWIEEQENGEEYTLFYLKLCLKSLKYDGLLIRHVGDMLIPYDAPKLAEITHTSVDTVVVALKLLEKAELVQFMDNGALFLKQLANMVGSETNGAARKRAKKNEEKLAQIKGGGNFPPTFRELSARDRDRDRARVRDKDNANALSMSGKPDERESGGSKEKKNYAETTRKVVDYLNKKTGSTYRATAKNTAKHVKARIDEGYTLSDFKKVIDTKCREWQGNEKMQKYLRPDTLFGTKFDWYLNQPKKKCRPTQTVIVDGVNLTEGRFY